MKDRGSIIVCIREGNFIFYKFKDGAEKKDSLLLIKEIQLDLSDYNDPSITIFYEKCFTKSDSKSNKDPKAVKGIEKISQITGDTTIKNPCLCYVALNYFAPQANQVELKQLILEFKSFIEVKLSKSHLEAKNMVTLSNEYQQFTFMEYGFDYQKP